MLGNLEPEERNTLVDEIAKAINTLGWTTEDEVIVKIGGSVVSGIKQPDDANPRWSLQYGERKYNNDAFIVIENTTRRPYEPSKQTVSD